MDNLFWYPLIIAISMFGLVCVLALFWYFGPLWSFWAWGRHGVRWVPWVVNVIYGAMAITIALGTMLRRFAS